MTTSRSLKGTKKEPTKSKEKITSLEKEVVDLKNEVRKEFIQSSEYEEYIGQAVDAVTGDMIFTMFLKHPNLDYNCLREAIIELVAVYKQMARDGKIEL